MSRTDNYYAEHSPDAVKEIAVPWMVVAGFLLFAAVNRLPLLPVWVFLGVLVVTITGIGYAVHVWVWSLKDKRYHK